MLIFLELHMRNGQFYFLAQSAHAQPNFVYFAVRCAYAQQYFPCPV